jgi:hypothetical protein
LRLFLRIKRGTPKRYPHARQAAQQPGTAESTMSP